MYKRGLLLFHMLAFSFDLFLLILLLKLFPFTSVAGLFHYGKDGEACTCHTYTNILFDYIFTGHITSRT